MSRHLKPAYFTYHVLLRVIRQGLCRFPPLHDSTTPDVSQSSDMCTLHLGVAEERGRERPILVAIGLPIDRVVAQRERRTYFEQLDRPRRRLPDVRLVCGRDLHDPKGSDGGDQSPQDKASDDFLLRIKGSLLRRRRCLRRRGRQRRQAY